MGGGEDGDWRCGEGGLGQQDLDCSMESVSKLDLQAVNDLYVGKSPIFFRLHSFPILHLL